MRDGRLRCLLGGPYRISTTSGDSNRKAKMRFVMLVYQGPLPCQVQIGGRRCRRRNRRRFTQITRSSTRRRASRQGFHWVSLTPPERCRCGTERPRSRTGRISRKARAGTSCTKPRAWTPRSRWLRGFQRPAWAAPWRSDRPKSTGNHSRWTVARYCIRVYSARERSRSGTPRMLLSEVYPQHAPSRSREDQDLSH
jgi:hypothetical protein